ncbi:Ferrous iron transport periplasmic protein [Patulibacter medicamentivorans]|uniref:Ferrous iron transport periplasmic protein n=1 Tax=Patulibacter medicamentivorans TaxID=1097667 RepID=H0E383_9ACTN|nr:iron uptake system protein EfeO [Patulibacter medicamentivorans]EHN11856.1 Ferrous iron transport periplasmic protein [Patulibacter medicamentivorans]
MTPFLPTRSLALAATAAATLGLAACGDDSSGGSGGGTELKVELTDAGCSPTELTAPAGKVTFRASNPGTSKTTEVELKNADGIILGERENITPGLSGDFSLKLEPGDYLVYCAVPGDNERKAGKLTVTGTATAKDAKDDPELAKAVEQYKAWVQAQSDELLKRTKRFAAALRAGDLQKAKDLFGPARFPYERIEPIAESFGDLDPKIDARVNDVADTSKWTGFHRIEQILWVKKTTKGTERYAKQLVADVTELDGKIQAIELQAAQLANGAVELLNEVSAGKITGEEDRYSHTDLSDFQGNLDGALKAFELLKPALVARKQQALIDRISPQFAAVQKGLDRYKRDTPLGFALYDELTDADRKTFSQQIDALAEPLSLVAGKVLD